MSKPITLGGIGPQADAVARPKYQRKISIDSYLGLHLVGPEYTHMVYPANGDPCYEIDIYTKKIKK